MSSPRDRALAAIPVATGLAWWFIGYVPHASPANEMQPFGVDLYSYFLPGFLHTQARLAAGEIPLWNPYEGFGAPLLAALQLEIFYPPRLLCFTFLPLAAAVQAYVCLHIAIAAVGSYALCRVRGRAPLAAVFGASICVAMAHFTQAPSQLSWTASLAWLPVVLLQVERVFFRPTVRGVMWLALATAMEILAGYPEIPLAAGAVTVVVVLVSSVLRVAAGDGRPTARGWAALAAGATLAIGLTSFELLPFAEMVGESWRTAVGDVEPMRAFFIPRLNLTSPIPGGFMPLFFVGGPALALLVVGALRFERNRLPLGVAAFLCWGAGSFLWPVVHALPLFRMSRSAAAWSVAFGAFAPMVAADGLDWVWSGTGRRWARIAVTVALGVTVLWLARSPVRMTPKGGEAIRSLLATRSLLLAALAATVGGVVRRPAVRVGAVAVLVGTTLSDCWGIAPSNVFLPLVPSALRDPWQRRMIAERVVADPDRPRILAPLVTERGGDVLAHIDAVTAYPTFLLPARTSAVLDRLKLVGSSLAAIDWRGLAAASGLVEAMGLRYALLPVAQVGASAALGFHALKTERGLALLERPSAAPRATLVHCASLAPTPADAFEAVFASSFDPLRCAVVEGATPALSEPTAEARETIELADYRDEEVAVRVAAAAPALLVLADAFYPGWEVTVDGAPRPMLHANYLFRAVALDAGDHDVRFRYRPRSFACGVAVTIVAVLVFTAVVVRARRRPDSET